MFDLLALITNKKYWTVHSWFIKLILCCYGVKVGKKFYIEGVPKLKIKGRADHIVIGDNISVLGDIDLRNRENGRIVFEDDVTIEGNCRFVSAREGTIRIGRGSIITTFAIINGGEDIIIGEKCIIGPRASINANDHLLDRGKKVREQGFTHAPVFIEDDCWLAANVTIMKGVRLRKGSVIGANAVVTKDTEEYSINGGVPAQKIGERV